MITGIRVIALQFIKALRTNMGKVLKLENDIALWPSPPNMMFSSLRIITFSQGRTTFYLTCSNGCSVFFPYFKYSCEARRVLVLCRKLMCIQVHMHNDLISSLNSKN